MVLFNIFNNIKYKIHEHPLENCRLLYINENTNKIKIPEYFSKYIVDIICVASHYSKRYTSSDIFLNKCNEQILIDHSYYLHNTFDTIVNNFIDKYIYKINKIVL